MEVREYKHINVQALQTQIQDSVEHEETLEVKLTMIQKKHPPGVLLPLITPLAQKLLQKKFSPYPCGDPLRTNILMKVLQTKDVKVTASIQPVVKVNLKT